MQGQGRTPFRFEAIVVVVATKVAPEVAGCGIM
jgi:hypothetical protein